MNPFINSIIKIFLVTLTLLWLSSATLARDKKPSTPQLKICWQFNALEPTGIQPTIKNGRVFLTGNSGQLLALNLANGETLWRTELGGEIVGQIPVNDKLVYVASQVAAAGEKKALITIRALSVETGLTIWQGELPMTTQISLALHKNLLLAAVKESDGLSKIFALAPDNGALLWAQKQSAALSTPITIVNNSFVFATTDKLLHVLKIADGHKIQSFPLSHTAQQKVVIKNGILLFGDSAGNVSAIRETDGKTLWTVRLGGAAEDILITETGVVISSLDDFVYFHNASNGKRLWRKRLASRLLGAALLSEASVLLATAGENSSTMLDLKKGRNLNQLSLGEDVVAVAAPVAADGFVLILTNKGLLTFAPILNACPTK